MDRTEARVMEAQEALIGADEQPVEPGVPAQNVLDAADAAVLARRFAPQVAVAAGAVLALGIVFVVVKRRRARRREGH